MCDCVFYAIASLFSHPSLILCISGTESLTVVKMLKYSNDIVTVDMGEDIFSQ